VGRKGRVRLRPLRDELARAHPELDDPEHEIRSGAIVVDGRVAVNPASLVRAGAAIALRRQPALRGEIKLRAALAAFPVSVAGRVALDVGAAAGGFTRTLLEAGARRVYAVDAGHGQLLGSLRQDTRVINLEATNLAELGPDSVPDPIELVTIDVSYLALRAAAPQLDRVRLASGVELIALVKPQFELRLARPPSDARRLALAVASATEGFAACGWTVLGVMESPARGARGALEYLLHARRTAHQGFRAGRSGP
jgi:23S rRNA (cytidine1920-2'-O)/16S rRNA (cytidine1409-2'-O)-methyltransferase